MGIMEAVRPMGGRRGKIKCLCRLTGQQKSHIIELQECCRKYDNTLSEVYLSSDMNYDSSMKCFFLYIEDCPDADVTDSSSRGEPKGAADILRPGNSILGFLTVFYPGAGEAEISGFVSPQHRRRGIFTQLLECAVRELGRYGIDRILIAVEPQSRDGAAALQAMGCEAAYSEYLMSYKISDSEECKKKLKDSCSSAFCNDLKYKEVKLKYTDNIDDARSAGSGIADGDNKDLYELFVDGVRVGSAGVYKGGGSCCIYNVEIEREHRGKGYGRQLTALLLQTLLADQPDREVLLQVSSKNARACHIYRKLGFKIKSQVDYYLNNAALADEKSGSY